MRFCAYRLIGGAVISFFQKFLESQISVSISCNLNKCFMHNSYYKTKYLRNLYAHKLLEGHKDVFHQFLRQSHISFYYIELHTIFLQNTYSKKHHSFLLCRFCFIESNVQLFFSIIFELHIFWHLFSGIVQNLTQKTLIIRYYMDSVFQQTVH